MYAKTSKGSRKPAIVQTEPKQREVSSKHTCINCLHLRADWGCDQLGLRRVEDPFMGRPDCPAWRENSSDVSYKGFPACTPEFEDLFRDTVEKALQERQGRKVNGEQQYC